MKIHLGVLIYCVLKVVFNFLIPICLLNYFPIFVRECRLYAEPRNLLCTLCFAFVYHYIYISLEVAITIILISLSKIIFKLLQLVKIEKQIITTCKNREA